MTPKEKAADLYNRFYSYDSHPHSVGVREERSKECALICVDEIINACEYNLVESWNTVWWNKVKEEINKL